MLFHVALHVVFAITVKEPSLAVSHGPSLPKNSPPVKAKALGLAVTSIFRQVPTVKLTAEVSEDCCAKAPTARKPVRPASNASFFMVFF